LATALLAVIAPPLLAALITLTAVSVQFLVGLAVLTDYAFEDLISIGCLPITL
jgi:hypothetical protein